MPDLPANLARQKQKLREKLRQGAAVVPSPAAPAHDRALAQIADRIEALATKVEQFP